MPSTIDTKPSTPAPTHSQAAMRWVSFHTRSLASVQGTRIPI